MNENKVLKEDVNGATQEVLNDDFLVDQFYGGEVFSFGLVGEFNVIGGQDLYYSPVQVSDESAELSIKLLQEELDELKEGFKNKNLVEQLDAMVDLMYVLRGVIFKSGLIKEFPEAFIEVHKNNMTKFPNGVCTKNEFGKIIKPSCYKSIDLGETFPHLKNI